MRSSTRGSYQFVGREQELGALRSLIGEVVQGPRAAFIVGEPGIGKTRLLQEATDRAEDLRRLHLVGFEPERQVPLGAAIGMLRAVSRFGGVAGERLSSILEGGDGAEPGGDATIRLFEAAYRGLAAAAPVLLVVDDMQWLDDLSRGLAHYLVRAALDDAEPIGIVTAGRPTPDTARFIRSVVDLFRAPERCLSISLGPLDRAEGVSLGMAIRPSLDEATAETLWSSGRGSPFWMTLAAHHEAHGPTDPEDPGTTIVGDLLRSVTSDASRCIAALAVAGRPVTVDTVRQLTGWPAPRTDAALGELMSHGLVRSSADMVTTAHDLVREAVAATLNADDATRLHRRLAELLEQEADGDIQMLLQALEHAEAAGQPYLRLGLAIARSPQRRLLGLAGLARLDLIADTPSAAQASSVEFKIGLAHLAEELSDHEGACDRFAGVCEEAQSASDRSAFAVKAARHALEVGRSKQMGALLEQARTDGKDNPWVAVAVDALEYKRLAWLEHDSRAAGEFRERAVAKARRLVAGSTSLDRLDGVARQAYAEALDAERIACLMDDDMAGMLAASEALTHATVGMGEHHLDCRSESSMALRFFNRWQEVEQRQWAELDDARRQVYPGMVALITSELALTVYNLGRVAEALDLYAEGRRLGTRVDAAFEVADTWLCGLGQLIEASTVDWRSAISALVAEADRQPNPHCSMTVKQRAAMCAARFAPNEFPELVERLLEGAGADARAADCVRCSSELCLVSAELYARIGRLDKAGDLLATWDAAHPSPHPRAAYLRDGAGAAVAAMAGDANAPTRLRDRVDAAAAAGLQLDQLWGLIDLGSLLACQDAPGAAETWIAASDLAVGIGAASEAAMVKRHLRKLGVRTVNPTQRTAGEPDLPRLSRRETEVARLAARGARNAEIATTLFISTKTVEQHLSRVFTRLGVRNRTELGARHGAQLLRGMVDAAN